MNIKMSDWKEAKNDSFYKYVDTATLSENYVDELIKKGEESSTGRARYCLHANAEAVQQLMLIYHDERTCVPVHRHKSNGEFIILLKGSCDVIFMNENFDVDKIIKLDARFISSPVWIPSMIWHTLRITSKFCLFFESTIGPFREGNVDVAPN
jgi:cupin fold WbuC family metalloprotein